MELLWLLCRVIVGTAAGAVEVFNASTGAVATPGTMLHYM